MMLVQGVCSPNSWQVVLLDWPSAEDRFKGQISHISCKPLCVFCLLYLWHRHKRSSCHAAAQGTAIHRACSMKGVTTLTGHNLQLRAAMIAIVFFKQLRISRAIRWCPQIRPRALCEGDTCTQSGGPDHWGSGRSTQPHRGNVLCIAACGHAQKVKCMASNCMHLFLRAFTCDTY